MPQKEESSASKWDEGVAKYDRNLRYEEQLAALRLGFYSRIAYDVPPFFAASVDVIDESLSLLANVIPNTNVYVELRRLLDVIKGRFQQRYQLVHANDARQIFAYPTYVEDARLVRACNRAIPQDLPHWQWYCLGAFFGELHAHPNRGANELQLPREFVDAYVKEFGRAPPWRSTFHPPLDEKVEQNNSLLQPLHEICVRLPQQAVRHSPLLKSLTELPVDALNVHALREIVARDVVSPGAEAWMPGVLEKEGMRGVFRVAYFLLEGSMSSDHVGEMIEVSNTGGQRTVAYAATKPPENSFMPTQLQEAILKALDGVALKKDALAAAVCGGEGTRLYRKGGITELREAGLVAHKHGVGYYRPGRPPPGAINLSEPKSH